MKARLRHAAPRKATRAASATLQRTHPFIKQQGMANQQHPFFMPSINSISSGVKFNTDAKAAFLAEQIHAKAFTIGNQIFFNKNQYEPNSAEGKKLIAHEMVHATQHQHIPGIKRKPKEETEEEKAEGNRARRSHPLFWNDLNKHFPDAGRKLAGTQYDKQLDYLRADFTEGQIIDKNKKVINHSAPTMVIGKKYVDEADEKIRTGLIPGEMAKIDDWRFANFRINDADLDAAMETKLKSLSLADRKTWEEKLPLWTTKTKLPTEKIVGFLVEKRVDDFEISDADIANPVVIKKLSGLNAQKLLDYKTKAAAFGTSSKLCTAGVVQKLGELLATLSLKKTSTPLQTNATVGIDVMGDIEKQVIQVAPNVIVEILPDEWTSSVAKGGETSITDNLPFTFTTDRKGKRFRNWSITKDANGNIASIKDPNNSNALVTLPAIIVFSIKTKYALGVDSSADSAYGRGKAQSDVAAGNKSLQFHEGNHGVDFVNGLSAITFPASFEHSKLSHTEFINMMTATFALFEASRLATDEAGEYGQAQYKKDNP